MKNVYYLTLLICVSVSALAQSNAKPTKQKPTPVDLTRFVLVEGGSFSMGSGTGIEPHEKPEHNVSVKSFYLAKYDVTFDDYDRYCDSTKTANRTTCSHAMRSMARM